MMTIIALSGKKQVGKDTFASVLINKHGFNRVALADPLKNLCARVFYLDPDLFDNNEKKDSDIPRIILDFHDIDAIRNIVENEWGYPVSYEAREGMESLHGEEMDTPRDVMRVVGMMLRDNVHPSIWIELAKKKIKEIKGKIVITDCRFDNERDTFKSMGAVTVLIKRNDDGTSTEHEFDLGHDDEYDVVIRNENTLHQYKSSIEQWYKARESEFNLYKVWKYE